MSKQELGMTARLTKESIREGNIHILPTILNAIFRAFKKSTKDGKVEDLAAEGFFDKNEDYVLTLSFKSEEDNIRHARSEEV